MKKLSLMALLMAMVVIMAACSNDQPSGDPEEKAGTEEDAMEEMTFTLEELAQYDGQDGNEAYVAVEGTVYNVTGIPAWTGGKHNGNMAGTDASEAIGKSPHGKDVLKKLPVVGKIAE